MGFYSCIAATILWRHVLDTKPGLHVHIGGVSMPPPALVGLGEFPLGIVRVAQVVSDSACP